MSPPTSQIEILKMEVSISKGRIEYSLILRSTIMALVIKLLVTICLPVRDVVLVTRFIILLLPPRGHLCYTTQPNRLQPTMPLAQPIPLSLD